MDDLHLASILRTPLMYFQSAALLSRGLGRSSTTLSFFSTFGLVFPHLKVSGLSKPMLLYNITANANGLAKHVHLLDQQ